MFETLKKNIVGLQNLSGVLGWIVDNGVLLGGIIIVYTLTKED